MSKKIELKPCPFCGRIPHILPTHHVDGGDDSDGDLVFDGYCVVCCPIARTPPYHSRSYAAKVWNLRAK